MAPSFLRISFFFKDFFFLFCAPRVPAYCSVRANNSMAWDVFCVSIFVQDVTDCSVCFGPSRSLRHFLVRECVAARDETDYVVHLFCEGNHMLVLILALSLRIFLG